MMDIETQIEVAQQWANTCRVAGNSLIADGFDRAASALIAAKGSIVTLDALKDDLESELTTLRAEFNQLRQRIADADGQEPAIRIGKGGNQININPDYTGPIHGEFYARPIPQVTDHVEHVRNMVPRITEQDAPIALTDEQVAVLGRPNFACSSIARVLVHKGVYAEIPPRSENEQAVAIHFLNSMLEKHGSNWKLEAEKVLNKLNADRAQETEMTDCACGDQYPANSYGAGFIDAAGHCPNCDASEQVPVVSVPEPSELDVYRWFQESTIVHHTEEDGSHISKRCMFVAKKACAFTYAMLSASPAPTNGRSPQDYAIEHLRDLLRRATVDGDWQYDFTHGKYNSDDPDENVFREEVLIALGDITFAPSKCRCELCRGNRGGIYGNENVIDGKLVCDNCHAELLSPAPDREGESDGH